MINQSMPSAHRLLVVLVVLSVAFAAFGGAPPTIYKYDNAGNITAVIDTGSDPDNCGARDVTCPRNLACAAGACSSTCRAGYGDCNANILADGCETAVTGNVSHCGACGKACSTNHMATIACSSGMCTGTCATGYGDCNNDKQVDGCETSLNSVSHCGRCENYCSDGFKCASGTCVEACAGVRCSSGLICDPDTGKCVKYIP